VFIRSLPPLHLYVDLSSLHKTIRISWTDVCECVCVCVCVCVCDCANVCVNVQMCADGTGNEESWKEDLVKC